MDSFSTEALLIGVVALAVGLAVLVVSVYQTVRLLRASRGGLAAAAFAVFLVWIPLSVVTVFFLLMFGSAHVDALHAHGAGSGMGEAMGAGRSLGIGYALAGFLALWLLSRLGRAARLRGD